MRTPITPRGRTAYDHLPPYDAIVKAWTEQGLSPYWHREAQGQVRRAMPVLARALDRAAGQRSPARADALDRAQAALDRVRELHQPCNHDAPCRGDCAECGQYMPCDTIRALDGEQ